MFSASFVNLGSSMVVFAYVYDSGMAVTAIIGVDCCSWLGAQYLCTCVFIDNHNKHWILTMQVRRNVASRRTNEFIEIGNLKVDMWQLIYISQCDAADKNLYSFVTIYPKIYTHIWGIKKQHSRATTKQYLNNYYKQTFYYLSNQ